MSSAMNSNELLKQYSLKVTNSRLAVLDLLFEANFAVSQQYFEEKLGEEFDRVTLYRTLNSFEEKGLTHSILGSDGKTRFALCNHTCSQHHHDHQHIHFECDHCGHTFCIDDHHVDQPKLPEGYRVREINIVVQGTCSDCSI